MKVSVAINNYNYAEYLPLAVASALNQTYPEIEVIVADDGSTDQSLDTIRHLSGKINIISLPHGGQIFCMNAAVAAATGDLIFLLDADDVFDAGKVQSMVDVIRQGGVQSDAFTAYHPMRIINGRGEVVPGQMPTRVKRIDSIFSLTSDWNDISSPVEVGRYISRHGFPPFLGSGPSCLVLSRPLIERVFPLPESPATYADHLIIRRALAVGHLYCWKQVLGSYRAHGENYWFGRNNSIARRKQFHFIRSHQLNFQEFYASNGIRESFDIYASVDAWRYFRRIECYRGLAGVAMRMLHRSCYWKNVMYAAWGLVTAGRFWLSQILRSLKPMG